MTYSLQFFNIEAAISQAISKFKASPVHLYASLSVIFIYHHRKDDQGWTLWVVIVNMAYTLFNSCIKRARHLQYHKNMVETGYERSNNIFYRATYQKKKKMEGKHTWRCSMHVTAASSSIFCLLVIWFFICMLFGFSYFSMYGWDGECHLSSIINNLVIVSAQ